MADLPASWTMLRSRRIGGPDGPDVPYVLVHPEFGVALIDLVPPASAGAAFEAFLARERFAAFYPGHLSIVLVGIAPTEIPAAGDKLADAFETAEPLTIADRDWADAVIELLLTPDARGAGEAPMHRAGAVPPPAPPARPAAAAIAAPVAIGRIARSKAAPAPRRRWPAIALTAALLALVAAIAIAAALPLLDERGPTTATSVPLPPTAQATAPLPPSVAATAAPTVAPSATPPPSSAQANAEAPPLPPMPVAAALPMIAPPNAPFALSRIAPLPPAPAPITAGFPMIPPPASPVVLSRVEPLPAPLPARKPPVIAEARPSATSSGARRERSRTVASSTLPRRVRRPTERSDLPPIDAADLPPLDGPVTPPPSAETAGNSGVPNTPPPQQQAVNTVAPPPPRAEEQPRAEERPREAPAVGLPVPLLPPAVSGSSNPPPSTEASSVVAASGGSQTCRPYRADATVTGLPEPVRGLACRDIDGHWQIVSEVPDR